MKRSVSILSLLLAMALAGCSRPASATHEVTLANMAFGRAPQNLHVGDAVEWVNADFFQHSATAGDGLFDVELPPKARVRTVLSHPGRIAVRCRYHPGMTVTLDVR